MSQGQLMGTLLGGHHQLDAKEYPFLGMFVDWATGGNAFKAELYFVGIRDFPSFRFGGRLDEVQDPQTGLIVTLRAFGEYALRVVDAPKLILNLVGTVDVTNNDAITAWVTQQLLKVTRTTVTTKLMSGDWPILGLSVHSPEIEVMAMQAANRELADYGHLDHPARQPRHQPGRRRQRAAEEAGGRHRLQPAGRRLPAGGPGRGDAGRGRGHVQGRRGRDPDVLRRRHGHGQPDDAGAGPGPGQPAAARTGLRGRRPRLRAAAASRRSRPRRPRPLPRPPSCATARTRSRWAASSAPSAASRCRSTAPTATPAWPAREVLRRVRDTHRAPPAS